MRPAREPASSLKTPPYAALHARMLAALASVEAEAGGEHSRELWNAIEEWWRAQQ